MSYINIIKFFKGPYLYTFLTGYDIDKILIRSPKMFYKYGISPMFLHNISPTVLGLIIFLFKASFGWLGYKIYKRYKKDEFDH